MNQTTQAICAGSLFVLSLGLIIGMKIADAAVRDEAIAHGAAHYDAKTGAFTWNSEKP